MRPRDPLDDAESTDSGGFFFDPGASTGERQALALEDLLARRTKLIQSFEGCERVAVTQLTRLYAPDSAGCNWSAAVVLAAARVAPAFHTRAFSLVVVVAGSSWN